MEGPPLGPGGEDITWPDQVAPRGRKASSTRKIKPQTSNLYRRLPLNLKRHLAARLWDITIGKTDVPPDWGNLVHPLYKKGDWANPDN